MRHVLLPSYSPINHEEAESLIAGIKERQCLLDKTFFRLVERDRLEKPVTQVRLPFQSGTNGMNDWRQLF
jgi:hypothetical protein